MLNGKNSTITVFSYDDATGALTEVQTISTLPEYFDGPNTGGELHVHRTGKWLYASNVGHNSVVLFTTDFEKGTLTFVEEQGTGGKKPLALRHRAVVEAPGDLEHGLRHGAGVPHRRGQRSLEALRHFRDGAVAGEHSLSAAEPNRRSGK